MTWASLEICSVAKGKVTFRIAFVTDLPVSRTNVAEIITCERSRRSVENEFRAPKNPGCHAVRNFGHGSKNLSSVLPVLHFLANDLHTACDPPERLRNRAREVCGTQDWMWRNLQALTPRFVFRDLIFLVQVLAREVEIPPRSRPTHPFRGAPLNQPQFTRKNHKFRDHEAKMPY